MEQIRALNSLEPFLAISKSATTPALAGDLIIRALSHPETYLFSPLLTNPQIATLANSVTYAGHFALLRLFAYGSYVDYTRARYQSSSTSGSPQLPDLTPALAQKLRQLSLLNLASHTGDASHLSYDALLSALSLSSTRELEDLVISAVYAGLLVATLDPHRGVVRVQSVSALRDVAPDSVPEMVATLERWSARCSNTLAELEERVRIVKLQAKRRKMEESQWEKRWGEHVETQMKGPTAEKKEKDASDHNDSKDHASSTGGIFKGLGKKLGGGIATSTSAGKRKEGAVSLEDDEYRPPNQKDSKDDKVKGKGPASSGAGASGAVAGAGVAESEDVEMADPDATEDEGYVGRVTRSSKKRGLGLRSGLGK